MARTPRFEHSNAEKRAEIDSLPRNLVEFQNGVYDFERMQFHEGCINHSGTLQLGVNLLRDEERRSDLDAELDGFLAEIFPSDSVRELFLRTYSTLFMGGNPDKLLVCWTGDGNNGKTAMVTLFERMLGNLGCTLPFNAILCKHPSSGEAAQGLVGLANGVRFSVIQAPSENDTSSPRTITELVCREKFFVRGQYWKSKALKHQSKFALVCSQVPAFLRGKKYKNFGSHVVVMPFESRIFPSRDSNGIKNLVDRLAAPLARRLVDVYERVARDEP